MKLNLILELPINSSRFWPKADDHLSTDHHYILYASSKI